VVAILLLSLIPPNLFQRVTGLVFVLVSLSLLVCVVLLFLFDFRVYVITVSLTDAKWLCMSTMYIYGILYWTYTSIYYEISYKPQLR